MIWRRLLCRLMGGHELHQKFDADAGRNYLACAWCPYEGDGWTIDVERRERLARNRRTADQDRQDQGRVVVMERRHRR